MDDTTGSWILEHFALSRGPASLLLLEFQDVSESGFLVAVDDLTPELAFHWLQGGLPIPQSGPWTRESELPEAEFEPASEKSQTHSHRFCTGCGKPLEPGKRFCTGCGTPLKEAGAHA